MRKCHNSRWDNFITYIGTLLGLCMGIGLIVMAVVQTYKDPAALAAYILVFVIGAAFCAFCIFGYAIDTREYAVTDTGIQIRYLGKFNDEYRWQDVSHICVCDVNYAPKDHTTFLLAVRIAFGPEKDGPANGKTVANASTVAKWRKSEYHFIHFRKILLIDYSEQVADEIRKASNREVDYLFTAEYQKNRDK